MAMQNYGAPSHFTQYPMGPSFAVSAPSQVRYPLTAPTAGESLSSRFRLAHEKSEPARKNNNLEPVGLQMMNISSRLGSAHKIVIEVIKYSATS